MSNWHEVIHFTKYVQFLGNDDPQVYFVAAFH